MSTSKTQEIHFDEIPNSQEEWEFFQEGFFQEIHTARVCMTCQHFYYHLDLNFRMLLACNLQHFLLPHGDHLISHCNLWIQRREKATGWCQEAA